MKNIKKYFLIVVLCIVTTLSLIVKNTSLIALAQDDNSSIYTSDVMFDISSEENFDENEYPFDYSIEAGASDLKIQLFNLVEYRYTDLFIYLYNPSGVPLPEKDAYSRITMDTHLTYSDGAGNVTEDGYSKYYLRFISKSENLKFYKYRVLNTNEIFSVPSDSRFYLISEIEFDFGDGFAKGSQTTISSRFDFTGNYRDENLSVSRSNFETIQFPTYNGSFTFDISTNIWGTSHPTIYYVAFPIDSSYGDVVGLRFQFTEANYIYVNASEPCMAPLNSDGDLDHKVAENLVANSRYDTNKFNVKIAPSIHVLDYSSKDKKTIQSWANRFDVFIGTFVSNFPLLLFNKVIYENYSYEFDVIEKIDSDDYNQNNADGKHKFNKYFLEKELIENESFINDLKNPSKNMYVLRYAVREYLFASLGYGYGSYAWYEMTDCDFISIDFMKNGVVYTLAVTNMPFDSSVDPFIDSEVEYFKFITDAISKMGDAINNCISFIKDAFGVVGSIFKKLFSMKWLWITAGVVLLIVILNKLIQSFKGVFASLKNVIKGIISIPAKLIDSIFGFFSKKGNTNKKAKTNKKLTKELNKDPLYEKVQKEKG